jgi:hypothetical protein
VWCWAYPSVSEKNVYHVFKDYAACFEHAEKEGMFEGMCKDSMMEAEENLFFQITEVEVDCHRPEDGNETYICHGVGVAA